MEEFIMKDAASMSQDYLARAIKAFASDIHFYPFLNKTDVYFRVHGKRVFIEAISQEQYELLLAYYKFTSGMDIGEIRKPQNGTIVHQHQKATYSLRLSTLPLYLIESLVIRILPQADHLKLEQLFLFPNQLIILKKWMKNKAGLILFTGATGSGKTTTLYALLESTLKESAYQTITLEDPVEKDIPNMLQVQVNEQAGITYQTGLKAALRHDPDIIMVGEIRDKETAHFAFEAALTGHLVLSTLHAKNAVGTIYRLLDMGIKPVEIEQALIAVAALELLPIVRENKITNRAAIIELVDESQLKNILKGDKKKKNNYHTFSHLRKKAFAYGFISEEVYHNL